ncbi:hypothetical protein PITCH_A920049 [uncultured Desulfobacterium sp.]|uniref:LPS export ABC transporter periplasmic protein LptC n=1 Tax=uncultured Desulfobacterium sp. TaxID=201089 RepID=A0A445N405_9BACT|nr:hypothetical protein PITCH_A920049 [uncultured Desulfobacterium sp.]
MEESLYKNKRSIMMRTIMVSLILAGLAVLICFYYFGRLSNSKNKNRGASHYHFPKPEHDIRGFRFDAMDGEAKVISIEADRFCIAKKKLYLFSFGMLNEVRLENASVHIFGRGKPAAPRSDGSDVNIPWENPTFKNVISKDVLSSFPVKKLLYIEMEPVSVMLHDKKSVVTRISADSASIRQVYKDIIFRGHVKVISGSRILITDQLSFSPEEGVIKADRHFELKTPQEQTDGKNLITDVFLKPMERKNFIINQK